MCPSVGLVDSTARRAIENTISIREEQKKPNTGAEQISRRESAKKLAKMAYVVPAILAVVKTTERPAGAGGG